MSIRDISKVAVRDALVDKLATNLAKLTVSQQETQAGAVHEEARSEGEKDMRSTESSYLARGLAKRVDDLTQAIERIKSMELLSFAEETPLALSALTCLEEESGKISFYFMAPAGGGIFLQVSGVKISAIVARSPLGEALIGKYVGDDLVLNAPGGDRELTILDVA